MEKKILVEFDEEMFDVYTEVAGRRCEPTILGAGHRMILIDPTKILCLKEGVETPDRKQWRGNTLWVLNDKGGTDIVYVSNSIPEIKKVIEQYGNTQIVKCGN